MRAFGIVKSPHLFIRHSKNMKMYPSIRFTRKDAEKVAKLFDYSASTEKQRHDAYAKYKNYIVDNKAPRYLYIVRCGESELYKIGITNNLEKRLTEHQTGCPYTLKYVVWFEADLDDFLGKEISYLETFLHKNYQSRRVRGEWFNLTYSHLADIVLFLELDRELGLSIQSDDEMAVYFSRFNSDVED
ncbi:hypothetical protein ATY35_11080 [Vibrio cidicii]|uniref:Bacteriophage T5 Orf172 DNA-binding domain-containing protein n=2 Tax=Vibrionaceae TaxID=641 RepID=A0ABR5W4Y8_9VIBR|nr:hypothetical protein ATY35_11080 [Vibrio cidicii]